jgi:DNA-binding PadR family transcriptional regulator
MRSSKGALAANAAILSLFLDGPESLANIRERMRRDYADALWSRSVVDSAIPVLLDSELIVLVHPAERPARRVYEVTQQGVAMFRAWVRESAMSPAPIREPLQLWIEHSTPKERPLLLSVLRESNLAALRQCDAARHQLGVERDAGKLGMDWSGTVLYAMIADRVLYWESRATRYDRMRHLLVNNRNRHKSRLADERG